MRKKWMVALMIGILALVTACGSDETGDDGESLKQVTLMLDWYPNAIHSYLYVAEENGYFAEEDLDVEFQFPANPTDPLTLAAAGKVTMGMYYQPDVIMAKANEDIPIKAVAAIVQEPLNHLVFRSDNPIQSPKDLEGKKVGYPGIPINEALVKTMMEADGADYDAVEMINVEFELGSSLISEQVDAVSGMFVNHEVPLLASEGYTVDYINPTDYNVPSYYEVVAVTSEETWEKEQANIEAFWRAARKGYNFMVENKEDALQILLDHQDEANFPLDKGVETESLDILLPKMEAEAGFGTQTSASWEDTANWLVEVGLIEEVPDVDEIFVDFGE